MFQRPVDPENIQVGDTVHWSDYPNPSQNYVEGVVLSIKEIAGVWRYELEVVKEVSEGAVVSLNEGQLLYPPVNGTISGGRVYMQTKRVGRTGNDSHGRYAQADKCECGAYATSGAGRGDPAHYGWCPWARRA